MAVRVPPRMKLRGETGDGSVKRQEMRDADASE